MESFWQNAVSANDVQQLGPLERWDIDRAYSPQMPPSKMTIYTRHAAFCSGVEQFDAPAFRLTKPEAVVTDPQQRLLMEKCAEALHQASAAGRLVDNSTGHLLSQHAVQICLKATPSDIADGFDLLLLSAVLREVAAEIATASVSQTESIGEPLV